MDLNSLPERNPPVPTEPGDSLTPREARAYEQFAREHAEQTRMIQDALLGSAK
ncbi:MAG TPA: hypothetical protein VFW35_01130 [Sphingomicrobium sp.]|nr:hypothetical protein [Sphingomicrobium sp.]